MFCAISGEVPQEPVVAKTTGLLFEKRVISKALKLEKKCPVTGTDLSEEDLLTIAANPIPPLRAAAPTNVNGLLYTLQQEWDETVLETFNLRQQLDTTRKELAHALYQYDAACRVIARLMKERDDAYNLLKTYQMNGTVAVTSTASANGNDGGEEEAMEVAAPTPVEEPGVSEAVVAEMNALCKQLSAGRKQRKPSPSLQSKENMTQLQEKSSFTPHQQPITAMTVKAAADGNSHYILTGSKDHSLVIGDDRSGKVYCKLNGHRGGINAVAFSAVSVDTLFSASEDKTLRIWQATQQGNYQQKHQIAHHSAVTGVTTQPTGKYLVTTTERGSWHFIDIDQGMTLKSVDGSSGNYRACCFHPDGLILGTGNRQGELQIWDVREQKIVSSLKESDASLQCVHFSENGFLTATGYDNGMVKIWDLRKLSCMKTFEMGNGPVNSVAFDYSGVYLGIGGGGNHGHQLQVKVVKDWSTLVTIPDAHNAEVTGLGWTTHASSLISASADQTVRIFSH